MRFTAGTALETRHERVEIPFNVVAHEHCAGEAGTHLTIRD
jgi:hypothetical protein